MVNQSLFVVVFWVLCIHGAAGSETVKPNGLPLPTGNTIFEMMRVADHARAVSSCVLYNLNRKFGPPHPSECPDANGVEIRHRHLSGSFLTAWNLIVLAASCCAILTLFLIVIDFSVGTRFFLTWLLVQLTTHHDRSIKGIARRAKILPRMPGSHPHAASAAHRLAATKTIDEIAEEAGYVRYDVQRSNREACEGGRNMHTAHDLAFDKGVDSWWRRFRLARASPLILSMIDVVYYTGFQAVWLVPRCVIAVYTLLPDAIAGECLDGTYRYEADGTVSQSVPGGANYRHPIYRPTEATTLYHTWFYSTLYETVVVQGSGERSLILFVPVSTVWLPSWITSRIFSASPPLMPDTVQLTGNILYRVVNRRDDIYVSMRHTSSLGKYCLTCPYDKVVSLQALSAHEGKVTGQRVREIMGGDLRPQDCALLVEMSGLKVHIPRSITVSFAPADVEPRAACEQTLPAPFVPKPHAFASNPETLARAIEMRLPARPAYIPSRDVCAWRKDFIKYITHEILSLEGGSKVIPWDDQAVNDSLTTPSQRARTKAAKARLAGNNKNAKPKPFVKLETGNGTKPRQILQLDETFNRTVARYAKPFASKLYEAFGAYKGGWFACKATPADISKRMADLLRDETLCETDYSSFDGSVGAFHRHLLIAILCGIYSKEHHNEIRTLVLNESKASFTVHNAAGEEVIKRKLDGQIVSGSGWTSVFGSIVNIWLYYCAARSLGNDAKAAIEMLERVMVFGDDGVGPFILVDAVAKVATEQGITTTSENNTNYVSFLARIYPRSGDGASFAQPSRAIGKLVAGLPTSDVRMRALSHMHLGYTPIVTELSQAILRIMGKPTDAEHAAYLESRREEAYKLRAGAWKGFTPHSIDMMEACLEDLNHISVVGADDVSRLCLWLESCETLTDLEEALRPFAREPKDVGGLAW